MSDVLQSPARIFVSATDEPIRIAGTWDDVRVATSDIEYIRADLLPGTVEEIGAVVRAANMVREKSVGGSGEYVAVEKRLVNQMSIALAALTPKESTR